MVKTYQRYLPKSCFGVIASPQCNSILVEDGKLAITGAQESVLVWNIKTGTLVSLTTP